MRPAPPGQAGSTTVGAALLIAAVCALALTLLGTGGALVDRRRAQVAAELAAVAAAAAAQAGEADPCAVAGRIARANRARLTGCRRIGEDVAASAAVAGRAGSARAGPADQPAGSAGPASRPKPAAAAAPARPSSTRSAPALSSGSLPLPHFGDWMHAGQPASQGQPAT